MSTGQARVSASENRILATRKRDVAAILERDLPWDKLSGQRVVVTGAGGFLGGYLTRTLLSLRYLAKVDEPVQVVAVVRNANRARIQLADVLDDPNLTIQEWDLCSLAVPDIGNCNYVLHAASQASPRFFGTDPVGTLLPNAIGTAALLRALLYSADPRGFLFVSSSEVYGSLQNDMRMREDSYGALDPTSVRSCYAEGKRCGEALCSAWFHQHQLPTYIVRPFHTYGPGLQEDDGRVFADFAFNVIRRENIVMTSDGSARRAFCYVSDAIAGFFTVLLTGEKGTPYNVANTAADLSLIELASLLVNLYPERKLSVYRSDIPAGSGYIPSNRSCVVPDTSRLQGLGWRANVDPADGFRRMIESYCSRT